VFQQLKRIKKRMERSAVMAIQTTVTGTQPTYPDSKVYLGRKKVTRKRKN
jgi:hypothetical protein